MSSTPSASAFPFTVINDLHYIDQTTRPFLEALMRQISASPAELVLVLGDLAETGSLQELSAAREILHQLKVPYYPVPGNHDGPPNRPAGAGAQGLEDYNRLFPGRRNYFFTHKGWQFLGLDTTNGSGYQHLPLTEETRAFATHAAQILDRNLPTILFTHFPLHPSVKYALADGMELLHILSPLNLRIVFSGHYHGLSENLAGPPFAPHLKLLTNRCCSPMRELHDGSNLRGYFQCRANADQSVSHQFTPIPIP